jgi:hypothetical protein
MGANEEDTSSSEKPESNALDPASEPTPARSAPAKPGGASRRSAGKSSSINSTTIALETIGEFGSAIESVRKNLAVSGVLDAINQLEYLDRAVGAQAIEAASSLSPYLDQTGVSAAGQYLDLIGDSEVIKQINSTALSLSEYLDKSVGTQAIEAASAINVYLDQTAAADAFKQNLTVLNLSEYLDQQSCAVLAS